MTPAGAARLSFDGGRFTENSARRIALVMRRAGFSAAGIAAESYVVLRKVTDSKLSRAYAGKLYRVDLLLVAIPLIVRLTSSRAADRYRTNLIHQQFRLQMLLVTPTMASANARSPFWNCWSC